MRIDPKNSPRNKRFKPLSVSRFHMVLWVQCYNNFIIRWKYQVQFGDQAIFCSSVGSGLPGGIAAPGCCRSPG
jgi:hypothetical protein